MFGKTLKDIHSVFAFDFKGHGYNTKFNDYNYSKEYFILESIEVLDFIVSQEDFKSHPIVIVGHSMGGSIATFLVEYLFQNASKYEKIVNNIKGLMIIDISEGTAKEALPFMESLVNSRPKKFKNIDEAVEYCYKHNIIQSLPSAKVSIPPLFEQREDKMFYWKVDLIKTKPYWLEWYEGLTKSFLSCRVPKLLLMAGPERMDKELTIGHMQGKFRLINIPNVGHFIQEDNFKAFSETAKDFIKVFKVNENFKFI